ncbi:MAG: glycosyltransferase [Hespellia sp.]|nr:glycosyltransferase [Hespellia sp.]
MELVSVIVPIYNAEIHLNDCIESIVNQTHENLEIILVDDGSCDQSGAICDAFAEKDNRIIVHHLKNGGVARARNYGIECARGKFIVFSDSDDRMERDFIERAVVDIQGVDYVSCAFNTTNDNGEKHVIDYMDHFEVEVTYNEYLECMLDYQAGAYWGANWGKLYRSKLIQEHEIRFESGVAFAEDFRFNLEYLKYVNGIALIHVPVYNYRVDTDDSLSKKKRDIEQYWREYLELYHRYIELYSAHGILEQFQNKLSEFLVGAYVSIIKEGVYNGSLKWANATSMCKKITASPEIEHAVSFYRSMEGRANWYARLISHHKGQLIAFMLLFAKKFRSLTINKCWEK